MSRSAPFSMRFKLESPLLWLLMISVASIGLWLFSQQTVEADFQGFGATTPGGAGQPIVHVTTLADSGAGSLREALSLGNRTIVFDLGGTITLVSEIKVKGAFITVDGFSAPSPGITLLNAGLYLSGTKNTHNVIIQGLRIRNASADGITVRDNAHHVVIDHVSAQGSADGDIDVTRGASDVTVQWSILAQNNPIHNLLVLLDLQAFRVTFHHNLFVKGQSRHPHTGWDGTLATTPPDTVADIRNNLIWEFSDYGTLAFNNTKTNVVRNFYHSLTQINPNRALRVTSGGQAYAQGNFSPTILNIDSQGNTAQAFPAASVTTTGPCTAAQQIVAQAGARTQTWPLDKIDQQYIDDISKSLATLILPQSCL
jgi:hypothetical protein